MGSIFIIQGIMIYIYAFDHNPPHIHVRSGTLEDGGHHQRIHRRA